MTISGMTRSGAVTVNLITGSAHDGAGRASNAAIIGDNSVAFRLVQEPGGTGRCGSGSTPCGGGDRASSWPLASAH